MYRQVRFSGVVFAMKLLGYLIVVADLIAIVYVIDRSPTIKNHAETVIVTILQWGVPALFLAALLVVGAFIIDLLADIGDSVDFSAADEDE